MARRGGCGGLIQPTPALSASERRRRDKPLVKTAPSRTCWLIVKHPLLRQRVLMVPVPYNLALPALSVDLTAHDRDGLLIDRSGIPSLDRAEIGLAGLIAGSSGPAVALKEIGR
jgi:hypothetical protein